MNQSNLPSYYDFRGQFEDGIMQQQPPFINHRQFHQLKTKHLDPLRSSPTQEDAILTPSTISPTESRRGTVRILDDDSNGIEETQSNQQLLATTSSGDQDELDPLTFTSNCLNQNMTTTTNNNNHYNGINNTTQQTNTQFTSSHRINSKPFLTPLSGSSARLSSLQNTRTDFNAATTNASSANTRDDLFYTRADRNNNNNGNGPSDLPPFLLSKPRHVLLNSDDESQLLRHLNNGGMLNLSSPSDYSSSSSSSSSSEKIITTTSTSPNHNRIHNLQTNKTSDSYMRPKTTNLDDEIDGPSDVQNLPTVTTAPLTTSTSQFSSEQNSYISEPNSEEVSLHSFIQTNRSSQQHMQNVQTVLLVGTGNSDSESLLVGRSVSEDLGVGGAEKDGEGATFEDADGDENENENEDEVEQVGGCGKRNDFIDEEGKNDEIKKVSGAGGGIDVEHCLIGASHDTVVGGSITILSSQPILVTTGRLSDNEDIVKRSVIGNPDVINSELSLNDADNQAAVELSSPMTGKMEGAKNKVNDSFALM
jgi:hypothetical protein